MVAQNNNWNGFESGTLDETSSSSGTVTVSGTSRRSGFRCALMQTVGATVGLPWVADNITDAGDVYEVGIAMRLPSTSPGTRGLIFDVLDSAGSVIFRIYHETTGELTLRNAADAADVQTIPDPFVANEYTFIQVLFEHLASGDIEVFIDGNSQGLNTGVDLTNGNSLNASAELIGATRIANARIDDMYIRSGLQSFSERLGGFGEAEQPKISDAFYNTLGDAAEVGSTLTTGTWADVSDQPFSDTNEAEYDGGALAGQCRCDEGDSPGPASLAEIDVATYQADGINFDGTNDYLSVASGLTGAINSKLVSGSFGFKRGTTGSLQTIMAGTSSSEERWKIELEATDRLRFLGLSPVGSTLLDVDVPVTTDTDNWHHCAYSFDMADSATAQVIIDNVPQTISITAFVDALLDFTNTSWTVGASDAGAEKYNGDLADFWWLDGVKIDLSLRSNLHKFWMGGGLPDLGAAGELPLAAIPRVFLSGAVASWHTNKGSGGGFTENGALTAASNDPQRASGVLAAKWLIRARRGNGSGTTHFMRAGSGRGSATPSQTDFNITLSTANANFTTLYEDFDIVPAGDLDNSANGFGKSTGGREVTVVDVMSTVLHVPFPNLVAQEYAATVGKGIQEPVQQQPEVVAY